MSHPRCWYPCTFDLQAGIDPDWNWPEYNPKFPKVWRLTPEQVFASSWLDQMQNRDLPVLSVLLFYKPARFTNWAAHIDTYFQDPTKPSIAGFNIVYDGEGSESVWYQLPTNNGVQRRTVAGTPFFEWPISELEEIERCKLGASTIMVRTDIPHAIVVGPAPRRCLSLRFDIEHATWENAVADYQDRGLLLQ
jgi:hypothetical protein